MKRPLLLESRGRLSSGGAWGLVPGSKGRLFAGDSLPEVSWTKKGPSQG